MGVHWCGWCNNMSGGWFCDKCAEKFNKTEKRFYKLLRKLDNDDEVTARSLYIKLTSAIGGCD